MDRWSTELLEFDALKTLLRRYVFSPTGRALLDEVAPTTDQAKVEESLASVGEAIEYEGFSRRGVTSRLRFDGLPDPSLSAAKLGIEGAVLEAKEILDLTLLLERASEVRTMLTGPEFPRLSAVASRMGEFRPLVKEFAGRILPDGSMADHASVALQRIRRDMEKQQRLIQESLEKFIRAHRDDGILQEEFIAIRNDRFVLPVVAGQKKKVDGVIHASSGTGQTLFIEPLPTIDLNNDLVRLREQEMREIHRILAEMTERLRLSVREIRESVGLMGELELLFAKARMAVDFECVVPRFTTSLSVKGARHPLLQDVLKRQRKMPVPLNLTLDSSTRTLLISGPNTGGKTVAMKTVGLFVLMAQSGIPVPCEDAELPFFDQVLADIGDKQSIEQSLSSFSAHVMRIKEMLGQLDGLCLVILDELGRATDPDEGGALGVAILDVIRKSGAFTIASTHLIAPKIYGATTEGVLNASMSFDEATLAPTYVMRTGAPGASAGLDIARRLGLPEPLIEQARASLSTHQQDVAKFLKVIEERLDSVTALEQEAKRRRDEIAVEQAGLKELWEKRESSKIKELERRTEAVLAQFEEKAEETISQIAVVAQQKKAVSQARVKVAQTGRQLREQLDTTPKIEGPAVIEGSKVRLKDIREPARVRRILGHGRIEVEAGFMKMQVSLDDVVEVLPDTPDGAKLPKNVTLQRGPDFSVLTREINIIGQHAEQAREAVDKFLDNAALASIGNVRIVHGHGMGILKRMIREMLATHPHVASFNEASPAEGGAGATIAVLRSD